MGLARDKNCISLRIKIARLVGAAIYMIGLRWDMHYPWHPMKPMKGNLKLLPVIANCHKASNLIQHEVSRASVDAGLRISAKTKTVNRF